LKGARARVRASLPYVDEDTGLLKTPVRALGRLASLRLATHADFWTVTPRLSARRGVATTDRTLTAVGRRTARRSSGRCRTAVACGAGIGGPGCGHDRSTADQALPSGDRRGAGRHRGGRRRRHPADRLRRDRRAYGRRRGLPLAGGRRVALDDLPAPARRRPHADPRPASDWLPAR